MRLRDAQVDYGNPPKLQVLADETLDWSDLRFHHDDGLWYVEKDGYVEYFSWSGNENDGSYWGRCFEITTVEGKSVILRGPWSSRAECINLRSFGPVVDVELTTDPDVLERRYTFTSASITLLAAKQAMDLVDEAGPLECRLRFSDNEPSWIPVWDDGGEL